MTPEQFAEGYKEHSEDLARQLDAMSAKIERVRNACSDFDANGNSCALGDPAADVWHKAATLIRCAILGNAPLWTLRDIDNRDSDLAPWEVTATPEELAKYIDGPVRGDIRDKMNTENLEKLIAYFRNGDLAGVRHLGPSFAIYVTEADNGSDVQATD